MWKSGKNNPIWNNEATIFVRSKLLDSKLIHSIRLWKFIHFQFHTPISLSKGPRNSHKKFPPVYGPSPPNLLVGTNHCILRISLLSVVSVSVCTKHTPGKGLKILKGFKTPKCRRNEKSGHTYNHIIIWPSYNHHITIYIYIHIWNYTTQQFTLQKATPLNPQTRCNRWGFSSPPGLQGQPEWCRFRRPTGWHFQEPKGWPFQTDTPKRAEDDGDATPNCFKKNAQEKRQPTAF